LQLLIIPPATTSSLTCLFTYALAKDNRIWFKTKILTVVV